MEELAFQHHSREQRQVEAHLVGSWQCTLSTARRRQVNLEYCSAIPNRLVSCKAAPLFSGADVDLTETHGETRYTII